MSSGVRSPRKRLYSRRAKLTISTSISSPPIRMDFETTIPPRLMTATSVVPPPMSTTSEPDGSLTGRAAPRGGARGRPAADVDDERTRRFADRQAGPDRGGHRFLDEAGPAGAGVEGRVLDRPLLDLGHARRDADEHPRPGDEADPVVGLVPEVLDHLLGHVEVADDPVPERPDGEEVGRG